MLSLSLCAALVVRSDRQLAVLPGGAEGALSGAAPDPEGALAAELAARGAAPAPLVRAQEALLEEDLEQTLAKKEKKKPAVKHVEVHCKMAGLYAMTYSTVLFPTKPVLALPPGGAAGVTFKAGVRVEPVWAAFAGGAPLASLLTDGGKTLLLRGQAVAPGGALQRLLRELPQQPQLEVLELAETALGDAGAAELAAVLPQLSVRLLDLELTGLGDDGCAALAAALPASRVEVLWLGHNQLRGCGEVLAGVLAQTDLRALDLSDNDLDDAAAAALAGALAASKVVDLDLRGNKVGSDAQAKVRAALPDAKTHPQQGSMLAANVKGALAKGGQAGFTGVLKGLRNSFFGFFGGAAGGVAVGLPLFSLFPALAVPPVGAVITLPILLVMMTTMLGTVVGGVHGAVTGTMDGAQNYNTTQAAIAANAEYQRDLSRVKHLVDDIEAEFGGEADAWTCMPPVASTDECLAQAGTCVDLGRDAKPCPGAQVRLGSCSDTGGWFRKYALGCCADTPGAIQVFEVDAEDE